MTRMIPPTIDPSMRSAAERRLFSIMQSAPGTEDWVCLHSLGLACHATKRRGEIDFLLVTRTGVFVLEVKGGRIRRQDGLWVYTDRFGNEAVHHESPFDQASSAMFSLERRIREAFPQDERLQRLLFGYGVLFPDIVFDDVGSDGDRRVVYDVRDRRAPIGEFVQRLALFARERSLGVRYAPSANDLIKLVAFLRGDFDLVPRLAVLADAATEKLMQLSDEQYAVLDAFEAFPRLIVQGGAGTGKTLLAVEAVRREARLQGGRVLFLCYNRLLAAFLAGRCAGLRDHVTVRSVFSFFNELIEKSALADEFRKRRESETTDTLYRKLYPEYATLALMEGGYETFDGVVVDEGQDMMTDGVLDVIDGCLSGGLEGGHWRVFCDANNQGAVYGTFEEAALQRLLRFGQSTILAINRRNTRQIADETTMLASPRVRSVGMVSGIPVEYVWCDRSSDQGERLRRLLARLAAQGVAPGRVTVLSPRNLGEACTGALADFVPVSETNVSAVVEGTFPSTSAATVSSFKGLENDFIVMTDIEKLDSDWWRSVVYVGMSRARVGLYVLLGASLRSSYEAGLKQWLNEQGGQDNNRITGADA